MSELLYGNFIAVKIAGIRPEMNICARILFLRCSNFDELLLLVAIGETHLVNDAIAFNGDNQFLREGIDYRHTHSVQPARELVVLIGKFSTRVKLGHNDFHAA